MAGPRSLFPRREPVWVAAVEGFAFAVRTEIFQGRGRVESVPKIQLRTPYKPERACCNTKSFNFQKNTS